MKINEIEKNTLSDAIDKITEGLDEVIELYNESTEDKPLIAFSENVNEGITKAIHKYGEEFVNRKINTLVGELLEWLPLDDVDIQEVEDNSDIEQDEDI
ncbi:atypical membrane-integrating protein (Mistic protein) [Anaerobacillus sp. MEB173]|uniref:atypical membrane-integrating protein (Mistic protein) n=1 Tax=Anaerobacillus sp. MEB173 TaxID=3383345 RepID=UPI003F91C2D1